jgi:K+-transporting ATPase ATPase C chain
MFRQMAGAAAMLAVLTIVTGFIYPLAMTGLAQALFPDQANGSVLIQSGVPVGSKWIGQNFTSPAYFHGRPSAAGKEGYDATSSSGSNLGPTNQKLMAAAADNIKKVREENGLSQDSAVPADLVLASGSGLDPHISPAAAYLQVERVARERGLDVDKVRQLVDRHVAGRQWGLLGEARVNVLELNLALDGFK